MKYGCSRVTQPRSIDLKVQYLNENPPFSNAHSFPQPTQIPRRPKSTSRVGKHLTGGDGPKSTLRRGNVTCDEGFRNSHFGNPHCDVGSSWNEEAFTAKASFFQRTQTWRYCTLRSMLRGRNSSVNSRVRGFDEPAEGISHQAFKQGQVRILVIFNLENIC